MMIQQIINIFSSSAVLSFLTEYLATKSIDKFWEFNKLKGNTEYQLIAALEESLESFCKIMEWEYDSTAITDTFIYSIKSLEGIHSKEVLKSILENATGMQVDNQQLEIWTACFNLSITQTERIELLNYLISNNIFKMGEHITTIKDDIGDLKNLITSQAMAIIKKIDALNNHNLMSDISISIVSFSEESTEGEASKNRELFLEYTYNRNDSAINIKPSMGYLNALISGKPISQISYLWEPFNWQLPRFDIKVVNNSDKTLFITEVVFKNIISTLDPSPVLILPKSDCYANARHILVQNDGWGKIKNMRMRLSACPVNSKEEINYENEKYTHELYVGDIEKKANIDVSRVLFDYGFIPDVDTLKPTSDLITRFYRSNNHLYDFSKIYGEFIYEGTNYTGKSQTYITRFESIVYLYEWNLAAMPPPPSYYYNVKFKTDEKGYDVYKSVSQVLKPKEYDRFVITVGLDKSSYHEFGIEVVTNLGTFIFPKVTLLAFIPRSGVGFTHTHTLNGHKEFLP